MSRKSSGRPTDAELAILAVLWDHGPCTVRDVQERLDGEAGYTTVLKFLQIMTEKALVRRDESQRAHIYDAACPREETQGHLVRDLSTRAFSGSASKLIMQALSSEPASRAELDEIRRLLDELEKGAS